MAKRRRKPRPRPLPPPPSESSRVYVRVEPADIAMFRFLLEAEDNLALFTVADRFRGILLLRFSPHQKKEFFEFLKSLEDAVRMEILPFQP